LCSGYRNDKDLQEIRYKAKTYNKGGNVYE